MSFYGVYDGHAGKDAAAFAASHLHGRILASAHFPSDPVEAIKDAFNRTDEAFLDKVHIKFYIILLKLRKRCKNCYLTYYSSFENLEKRKGFWDKPWEEFNNHFFVLSCYCCCFAKATKQSWMGVCCCCLLEKISQKTCSRVSWFNFDQVNQSVKTADALLLAS